ncbi:hypothetical protein [Tardiphaga sp.]|uniref:hypothetical protein n=1 Tax=Tardiphaga sp. TaxID=1926292 RepID=UPI0026213A07|nr:hypothetical protein [Tardiphaga sp.]
MNTELGQTLPYVDCVTRHSWSGVATVVTLAVAIAASAWSARTARQLAGTERFVALSGSGISSIVAFAVVLQGVATLVVDPCMR